ncbi:MAG: DUF2169 domain-containing protein [Polyangiaceae bacterium]
MAAPTILVHNATPYAVAHRSTSRRPPAPEVVLIVRGRFVFAEDGTLRLPEGRPIEVQGAPSGELFHPEDDDHTGECIHPSDLVDFKTNAEVMLRGTCHVPKGAPVAQCGVHFGVGAWSKSLRVVGPRVWVGDAPSDPVPFISMPVTYARAFGGKDYKPNPAGVGIGTNEVPNVEAAREPIQSRSQKYTPGGFGPINCAWTPRAEKLGKGKSKYGRGFHPDDFDWTYFQSAPADQQIDGYLKGDELLTLQNLHPSLPVLKTKLAGTRVRAFVNEAGSGFSEVKMVLDTVFVDGDAGEVYLTWRGLGPSRDMALSHVTGILFASESFDSAPLSASHYQAELEARERDPRKKLDPFLSKDELALIERAEASQKGPPVAPGAGDPLPAELEGRLSKFEGPGKGHLAAALARVMSLGKKQGLDLTSYLASSLDRRGPPSPGKSTSGLKGTSTSLHEKIEEARWQTAGTGKPMPSAFDDYDAARAHPEVEKRLGKPRAGRPPPDANADNLAGKDLTGEDFSGRDLSQKDLRGSKLDGALLARTNLRGALLAGASLEGAVLDAADLTGADLAGANLTQAVLNGATLSGASLVRAVLTRALFNEANLSGADLSSATGESPIFTKANMDGASLREVEFVKLVANESTFKGASLVKAKLLRSVFSRCSLEGASLEDASLDWASFVGSKLPNATAMRAAGEHTTWCETDLSGADFRRARLPHALFNLANAKQAKFGFADLRNGQFFRALLERTELDSSNLYEAKFNSAVINGASFRRANLFDARFIDVVGVGHDFSEANLKKAIVELVDAHR